MSTRISGLASGMDIDSLVKNMMRPSQIRIDRVVQQKTKGEWMQEAYNTVNATLAKFVVDRRADFGLTANSATGSIYNRSIDSLTWLKKAESSEKAVISVSANAGAVDGSVTVNVRRLAANWSAASAGSLPALATNADGSKVADNLANQFGLGDDAKIDFTLTTAKGKLRITSDQNATATTDVKLIKVDLKTTSLTSLANTINGANVGVKASYDSGIRRFFLQTANSGSENTLSIADSSSGLGEGVNGFVSSATGPSLLGLASDVGDVRSDTQYSGIDALLDIGAAVGITQGSNEFTVNNVNYSLHKLGETTVTVNPDIDSAYTKIKTFVEEYNKLIDGLNTKLAEKYDRDYQPLTDEQREAMTEEQIKKWEERAKTGLLSDSGEISSMLSNIRSGIVSSVSGLNGRYTSLSSIGIGTAAYSTDGKLVIEEAKLKKALQDDTSGVVQLLFRSPESGANETEQRRQTGVINRMFNDVIDGMKNIIDKAGTGDNASLYRSVQATILLDFVTVHKNVSTIDQQLDRYDRTLLTLNDRFTSTETRYYRQFTAMEQAIQRANQQSAWLSQQFASWSSK